MKMSTKGRYAVMAMIDIAAQAGDEPVSLAEIAERQDISQGEGRVGAKGQGWRRPRWPADRHAKQGIDCPREVTLHGVPNLSESRGHGAFELPCRRKALKSCALTPRESPNSFMVANPVRRGRRTDRA